MVKLLLIPKLASWTQAPSIDTLFFYLVLFFARPTDRPTFTREKAIGKRWPAPLYNLYFDSFLLICTSFVVKTRGIVCVVYPLSRLANYRDPCKRCVLDRKRNMFRGWPKDHRDHYRIVWKVDPEYFGQQV